MARFRWPRTGIEWVPPKALPRNWEPPNMSLDPIVESEREVSEFLINKCKHCGEKVQELNYLLGKELMHVEKNASFPTTMKGTVWRHCRLPQFVAEVNKEFLCPECEAGKHDNCDGSTLNKDTDEFEVCPCFKRQHYRMP